MVKQLIERILSPDQVERLHHRTSGIRARFYRHDLKKLARLYGSDKWGAHWYAEHYEHHFRPLQKRHLKVLEIGIGGEERPNSGGASLRMWASYFPHGAIHGIDICDKSFLQGGRIKVFQGSQADAPFLKKVIDEIGTPDIIIDDGSHLNEHVLQTFQILFPLLAADGIYVVEDTQTSYWPDMGGSSDKGNASQTMMTFFKSLTDGLNYAEFIDPGYVPSDYDQHIVSMHFYHNLLFIYKGLNDEGSNRISHNEVRRK
jgi:hypothetical protein